MKDIYGHHLPIIEDNIMGYFDNAIVQINKAQKDLAADNAAAAKVEYGRGTATGSVPLSSLARLLDAIAIDKLISAGCALSNQCEYAPLRAQWWACVKHINDLRGVENDQS